MSRTQRLFTGSIVTVKTIGQLFFAALVSLSLVTISHAEEKEHPNLILTKKGVEDIRANLGSVPVFDNAVAKVKAVVDQEIAQGIDTPIPKDFSGGYTHERHKLNMYTAEKAGLLYQILQDDKYAQYVKDMLFQYEAMYKDLPVHPQTRSYARGKLFWQCLNDSNWLVYMAQAYDTIYNFLSEEERNTLENNLFRPFADYISIGNPQFYNRIHNHSTWGNAAVGMIGLVMDDDELVERALYGLEDDGLEFGLKDNDGGFIKVEGQKAGFLANLEEPFSPEGYFTEGPYYQRYAMYPFLIFALGMENMRPEVGVLQHKDNVLIKGVYALLNLADKDGEFFPLNDGQKGMSYGAREVISVLNIGYFYGDKDPRLLSIAEKQGEVLLDQSGLSVALGIKEGLKKPYIKQSVNYGDGPEGNQGGVAVLRQGEEELAAVFKYTAHGLSHGHYDKLSYSLFESGSEVLQDYGLVRFVNIEKKGGGNYLPENTTWAKQTVAHNTIVQNETSHFGGKYEVGSAHHSDLYFYDDSKANVHVVSAKEENAYPGTEMHRTLAMITDESFEKPFLLDIMRVESDASNQYDLPFYYMGQMLETNVDYTASSTLSTLGDKNGYEHLYLEAKGSAPEDASTQFTWMGEGYYYTITSDTTSDDEVMFTRLGATDPDFNLRRDPAIMLRRNAEDSVFASVVEPHGGYSPVTERSINANSSIKRVETVYDENKYTAVKITTVTDKVLTFIVANENASAKKKHSVKVDGKKYKWRGPYHLIAE